MRVRLGWLVFAGALSIAGQAAPLYAEPVNVIGGSIYYSRSNLAWFDVILADGGRLTGEFGDDSSESWTPPYACFPCTPGAAITPSISESFPRSDGPTVFGTVHFRGADYGFTALSFNVMSDPVMVPSAAEFAVSNAAQFVLRGLATGWTADHTSGVGIGLLGYGKASLSFLDDHSWYATTYRFEDPAAVPEPATLLLFATGAALAARRRRNTMCRAPIQ